MATTISVRKHSERVDNSIEKVQKTVEKSSGELGNIVRLLVLVSHNCR